MPIIDVSVNQDDSAGDKQLSQQYNLEKRGTDNSWLYEKMQLGWFPSETYTQIQIIRDACEATYPGLWDIQVNVTRHTVSVINATELIQDTIPIPTNPDAPLQLMGPYYGYEPYYGLNIGDRVSGIPIDESHQNTHDTAQYYLRNYPDYNGRSGVAWTEGSWRINLIKLEEKKIRNSQQFENLEEPITILDFFIMIKFPEITITNSDERVHHIRDIFFAFELQSDALTPVIPLHTPSNGTYHYQGRIPDNAVVHHFHGIDYCLLPYRIRSVRSIRQTFSPEEFAHGYLHSHSTTRHFSDELRNSRVEREGMYWSSCCLGEGEINNVFTMLTDDFSFGMFILALHQLHSYASWESLSGGPHIRMNKLSGTGDPVSMTRTTSTQKKRFLRNVYRKIKNNPDQVTQLDWQYESGIFYVLDNEKLSELCKYGNSAFEYDPNIAYFKDRLGRFYNCENHRGGATARYSEDQLKHLKFIFKGEWQQVKIVSSEAIQEIDENDYVFNKSLITHIKEKIESYANYQKIRNDIIKRASIS